MGYGWKQKLQLRDYCSFQKCCCIIKSSLFSYTLPGLISAIRIWSSNEYVSCRASCTNTWSKSFLLSWLSIDRSYTEYTLHRVAQMCLLPDIMIIIHLLLLTEIQSFPLLHPSLSSSCGIEEKVYDWNKYTLRSGLLNFTPNPVVNNVNLPNDAAQPNGQTKANHVSK